MSTTSSGSTPPETVILCKDRSGFLFAHDCDRPAEGKCSHCERPICKQHTRMVEEKPMCIACVKKVHKRLPDSEDDPYWLYEDEYGDDGYYEDYYDDEDYGAFEDEEVAHANAAGAVVVTEFEQEFDAS